MANKEHLNILKQGVKAWNVWREANPNIKPNLAGADLSFWHLHKVNLSEADLSKAHLTGANLSKANLSGADLREANLYCSNLYEADLPKAHLPGADLGEATLSGADLRRADLSEVDLRMTKLFGAHLGEAHLYGANLIQAKLNNAIITGACLYGTARDDWMIDGIICDYVYWDNKPSFSDEDEEQEKQWELKHRTPKDRDFQPGEFEELYKHLPTFDYYFKHGFTALDAVVMSRIVEAINEKHPKLELDLVSFDKRGQPHAKFTVLHKESIEEAKSHVTTDYEGRIAMLEGKQEQMMNMFSMLVGNPQLPAGDVNAQLDHIRSREEAQRLYTILNQKLGELRQAYILETDPADRFKLKHQITQAEEDLKEIEQRFFSIRE